MPSYPGRVFAAATVLPAAGLAAWLAVAFPLLLAGVFTPVLGAVLGGPAVAAALYAAARWTPALPARSGQAAPEPWWPVLLTGAIALAFAAVQLLYHAEALVVRRDPSSYAQFAIWIAGEGSLPIPQGRDLIAGNDPGLTYESLAFYAVGDEIWPQFLAGAPLVYAIGHWIAGPAGMVLVPPIVGGLAVLTFGGLTARLVGAGWAPLAAGLLAVTLPEQITARSTYSEPVAQVLLLGALSLAIDALARSAPLRGRWGLPHALAGAAGFVFGLGLLVRIDALRDLLPVVVFLGICLLARRGQAVPMALGLAAGTCYGLIAGFGLSRPYLDHLSDSLDPLLAICAAVLVATAVATAALWRRGLPPPGRPRWLPTAAAVLVAAAAAGLALRPLLLPEYGHGDQATADFVGQLQRIEGLAYEPDRNYYDMSLYWVGWYAGPVTVVAATAGAALLVRRILQGRAPDWVLPTMVLAWSVAATLARPAITPDHPWASRRLVVLVLPAFILFAVWFADWVGRRIALPGPTAAVAALLLVVPAAVTAAGAMGYRSDAGSVDAADRLCRALPPDASVVLVDGVGHYYGQLIRGMCRVPVASAAADLDAVARAVDGIRARDRTPVLAAENQEALLGFVPADKTQHVFRVEAEQDPSTLMEPPTGSWAFTGNIWIAVEPKRAPAPGDERPAPARGAASGGTAETETGVDRP